MDYVTTKRVTLGSMSDDDWWLYVYVDVRRVRVAQQFDFIGVNADRPS